MVLAYTFFKPYISKMCNGFLLYIYDLESNWIWTLRFLHLIIHLAQKLKIKWDTWCNTHTHTHHWYKYN